jgi:hypothetical protein
MESPLTANNAGAGTDTVRAFSTVAAHPTSYFYIAGWVLRQSG